jgi:hypothetical protein
MPAVGVSAGRGVGAGAGGVGAGRGLDHEHGAVQQPLYDSDEWRTYNLLVPFPQLHLPVSIFRLEDFNLIFRTI